jgi:hypothetical protein
LIEISRSDHQKQKRLKQKNATLISIEGNTLRQMADTAGFPENIDQPSNGKRLDLTNMMLGL